MVSPICLVNGSSTLNGVNVTGGSTVTISLFNVTGVTSWSLSCTSSNNLITQPIAAINAGLVINQIAKTATFTAPSGACALQFTSIVNNGKDVNNTPTPSYTTTFGTWVLAAGSRLLFPGERTESSAVNGWTEDINNFMVLFGDATPSPTPNTLALRDDAGRVYFSSDGGTHSTAYGQDIVASSNTTLSISSVAALSNIATNNMSITTQAPFASATGSNRLPGNLNITIPAAAGALATTTSGEVNFNYGALNFFKFYADIATPQSILQFPHNGQILQCTVLASSTNLDLDIGPGSILSTKVSGVSKMEFSYNSGTSTGLLDLKTNGQITALTQLSIGSPGNLALDAAAMNISSNALSLDSPAFTLTSAGDVSFQSDNNMTFNVGGNFTLNNNGALFSIVNQGAGILLSDPAGAGITIDCNGGGDLEISAGSGIDFATPAMSVTSGQDFNITVQANTASGGTGYAFTLGAGAAPTGASTGGNMILLPGTGAHNGNIALFGNPSSSAGVNGGSNVVWMTDRTTAPGSNPSGGTIFYSESGVFKIRSVGNTVTLGNKPAVTGSKVSGAALASLLTVLATAGIITDSTTA